MAHSVAEMPHPVQWLDAQSHAGTKKYTQESYGRRLGSALRAEDLADFAVDSGRVVGRRINHLPPLLVRVIEFRLGHEIGRLHDSLNGITQVMRQDAQPGNRIGLHLLFFVCHLGRPLTVLQDCQLTDVG